MWDMKHIPPRTLAEFFAREGAPSMAALARQLNVTSAYMSMLASGKRRSSARLAQRISKLTGVPAKAVVSDTWVAL